MYDLTGAHAEKKRASEATTIAPLKNLQIITFEIISINITYIIPNHKIYLKIFAVIQTSA
jgi:hypothetical protein